MRRPVVRSVVDKLTPEIAALKAMILADAPEWMQAQLEPVKVFVTKTRRGRASIHDRNVTVPLWAWDKGVEYAHYYLAHELAHHVAVGDNHGPRFQAALQRLTPWAHHELKYKPRRASAAGIREPIT